MFRKNNKLTLRVEYTVLYDIIAKLKCNWWEIELRQKYTLLEATETLDKLSEGYPIHHIAARQKVSGEFQLYLSKELTIILDFMNGILLYNDLFYKQLVPKDVSFIESRSVIIFYCQPTDEIDPAKI